jgi:hypothetical protein
VLRGVAKPNAQGSSETSALVRVSKERKKNYFETEAEQAEAAAMEKYFVLVRSDINGFGR